MVFGAGDTREVQSAGDVTPALLKKKVGQLCTLLKPTARASTDDRVAQEQALLDLNSLLDALIGSPDKISSTAAFSRRSSLGSVASGPRRGSISSSGLHALEGRLFQEKLTTFGRVPKAWLWQCYSDWLPAAFQATAIRRMEAFDPDTVRKIVEYDIGKKETSLVPACCQEKRVFKMALATMREKFGCRVSSDWLHNALKPSGEIDWQQHGVFRPGPNFPHAVQLGFKGQFANEEIPAGFISMFASDAPVIEKNWKDAGAHIKMTTSVLTLSTLFANHHTDELFSNQHFKAVAEEAKQAFDEEARKASSSEVVVSDEVASACKRRRRSAPGTGPGRVQLTT